MAAGTIQTVLGAIEPEELGWTQMHEHLLADLAVVPEERQKSHASAYAETGTRDRWLESISLENYYEARRNPFLFKDALQLSSVEDAIEAAKEYRQAGGDCLVDVTCIACGRDPLALQSISRQSGVKIVMGTGYYVSDYHPPQVERMSEDELVEELVREISVGADDGSVKPGIIGEIGLTWPVHPQEVRSLRSAARAQAATGLALTIHPGRNPAAPMDAVRIVEEAGGDVTRTVLGHLDRTLFGLDEFAMLAGTGCYLELDLFGWETAQYPLSDIDMPNDAIRVDYLIKLSELGYAKRLLVAQDLDSKVRLRRYGGEGFQHILSHVTPIMTRKGMTQADIDRITIENPRDILTIA